MGPKLLEKRTIHATLATERKQEIDKGLKLSKAIEALREERVKEEVELEEFRKNIIARVQLDIDLKVAERDELIPQIARLKEERVLAQAPLNLKEEWLRVREDKQANATWQERNTQQSLELLAREEDNRVLAAKLEKEEEQINEEHKLSLCTLKEAEAKHELTSQALERAERSAQKTLQDAQEAETRVKVREEDATLREVELSKREEDVQAHEQDLSNRELKLKNRQEVFMRAQAYIKNRGKI